MRRLVPMVSSALMLLTVASFLLAIAEGSARSTAYSLGYSGATIRIIAITDNPDMVFVGTQHFTDSVRRFAADNDVSVAFSPSNGPDIITLVDPQGRYRVGSPQLHEELEAGGSRAAAAVSTFVAPANRSAVVPEGVDVIGEFSPEVAFDGEYPAVLLNAEAAAFDSGIFLIAGADMGDPAPVQELFEQNGMDIQYARIQEPATFWGSLASVFGVLAVAFTAVVAVAALLVALIHASFGRERLVAAAVLGAARGDLRLLVLRALAPQVAAGLLAGCLLALVVVFGAGELMLVSPGTAAVAVLAALGVCAAVWCAILAWACGRETRRCQRAVPC